MINPLQGLFPAALAFATTQEGLTGAIDLKIKIVGSDL